MKMIKSNTFSVFVERYFRCFSNSKNEDGRAVLKPHKNMGGGYKLLPLIAFSLFFSFTLSNSDTSLAADQENCLFCHQYPLLGTVDDNGTYSSYYISEDHYMGSVHQSLSCSECHVGITKVPHEQNLKVNCMSECHMDEPAIGRKYSHTDIDEIVKASVHDPSYKYLNEKGDPADFPTCISCHKDEENKVVIASRKNLAHVVLEESRGKCFDCHSDLNSFVSKNLVHVLRRTEKTYSQKDIMDMCISCHNDSELNERHKMVNAIYTYLENYHGKTMALGLPTAPSCIDCHVPLGQSPHLIKSQRDPSSATFPANNGKTCTRADCHPNASLGLGDTIVHVLSTDRAKFPIQFYLMAFFTVLTVVSFVSLMLILILELIRMIFPNFAILKKGEDDHE